MSETHSENTSRALETRDSPGRVSPWRILKGAVRGFLDDNVMSLAASLSFYTLLSFAPLLVLAVWSGSLIGYDAQQTMLDQLA
ncbi:MAG: hypothetical protein WCD36_12685, partial [Rhodanobacteraceae bacterium]